MSGDGAASISVTDGTTKGAQPVRLTLWVLLVVYVFNFIDRQIVNILAEPIARDLKLSDTQTIILKAAANRDDGLAVVPPKLPAAARNAVARSLEKNGLLEDVRPVPACHGWRPAEDGTQIGLRITRAGLVAIGVDRTEWPAHALQESNEAPPAALAPDPPPRSGHELAAAQQALSDSQAGPAPRATLRQAAAAVLAAWDGAGRTEAKLASLLDGPIAHLRVLPVQRPARSADARRKPREATK